MQLNTTAARREARDLTMITLGLVLYTIGFCGFILPHAIVIGGLGGFGTLVYYASGGLLPVAAVMYGTNILLLIGGWKWLGRSFVVHTIYGSTVLSLMIGATEGYVLSHTPLIASTPLSVAVGALLLGCGIGVYYSHNGTTGGTDIVAAIMSHRRKVRMGRVMLVIDVVIVSLSIFLPNEGDLTDRVLVILYGLLAIVIYSLTADRVNEYIRSRRSA